MEAYRPPNSDLGQPRLSIGWILFAVVNLGIGTLILAAIAIAILWMIVDEGFREELHSADDLYSALFGYSLIGAFFVTSGGFAIRKKHWPAFGCFCAAILVFTLMLRISVS